MSKKTVTILILIIIVLAVGLYYWKFSDRTSPNKAAETAATFGEDIADKLANPGAKLPDVNPYDAKTNPFEGTKTNPFKDVYKNPFE